ncbi:ovarian cancer G-protein coupled receptor 1 [Platysternon megacephalum]|uniref:Ovarian cancer G-protein coupled receptor 1 n=1 Tax=Platysternon megacephalum TaxID=55544 RepID=A0A4D9FGG7_9SAUR|nr:ovarian cancer G-protein coupled receptor 1 [Platysternon megacephalum]
MRSHTPPSHTPEVRLAGKGGVAALKRGSRVAGGDRTAAEPPPVGAGCSRDLADLRPRAAICCQVCALNLGSGLRWSCNYLKKKKKKTAWSGVKTETDLPCVVAGIKTTRLDLTVPQCGGLECVS